MVNQLGPTRPHVLLRDALSQLLEESFVPSAGNGSTTARPLPLDVYATPDQVVILAAVPGMDPQALEITYNRNVVTLSGTMPSASESAEGKDGTWYLSELWHGQFRRSLTLPFEIDANQATATFEHGIVRIVLPKAASSRPQKIAVQVLNGHQPAISAESRDEAAS